MKKTKFAVILVAMLLVVGVCVSACNVQRYEITLDTSKKFEFEVGADVSSIDFTQYFIVTDQDGNVVPVTQDMLDLSRVDTSRASFFTVILTIGRSSKPATFRVVDKQSGGGNQPTTPGGNQPTTPSGNTMEKQTYNSATFNHDNLQDKLAVEDFAIGLPSTGTVNALVIPVQFVGDTITQTQLDNLDKALNGNSNDTGWESVSTYYQKSSYGKLNLTFDIQNVYQARYNSSYYETYKKSYRDNGQTYYVYGDEVILEEALGYYENRLDLTKYDNNNDDVIDAVYLIYSAPVDYYYSDFYWAYTTWCQGEETFDGIYAYYYLFAGFDFMDEYTSRDAYYDAIPGLKVNAETYIHETGHMLGLDDYYDYDEDEGGNEGLGGADMMDYNVGDHGVYSKIMLGWLTPTIVNDTQTVTIRSSQAYGDAILIPLNFDNSYFCEYLLIDLYSATGLNAMRAQYDYYDYVLYGGASYGVRIYHVSSSINDPWNNDYGSVTDYNNTDTAIPLIKLVEADGETKFKSTDGYAAASDLWKAGSSLSQKFPSYKRNDGKLLNFNVTINSVSATQASITVTFK